MLPFLVFHISLIVVLCRAGHYDSTFREGFFVLFTLLSVVDAWTVIQTGDNPVLETSLASDLSVFVSCYCYVYQPLAHVLIACNRFNAFRSPNEYRWSWRDRSLKIVVGVTFAVPMLLIASVLPLKFGNFWKDNDPLEMQKLVYLLLHFYRASFLAVGSVVGFTLTLFALMYIRKRSSSGCSQVDGHERKLLGASCG
ncbi:hypothetical protein AAVH_18895 [Aphelenchoides avenae]|nr:hypothetical protein AAVH_18895 [Aphelenchus avenae]